ncbi:hypothetical protein [Aquihabitans sp. McL0605]|uniref:hypothetical protein n=1 Tax=Aquihabitans sp. McL0605 TaxID=3415671 RepID=UPI003CEB2B59
MTEPTDHEPVDPADPADAADRAWFHQQVDPVIDAEPIADAWTAISARAAAGDGPDLVSTQRRPLARWLGAAAVIVVLIGAAAVVANRRSDDGSDVVTGGAADATGFYIPHDLPDGWSLHLVEMIYFGTCATASHDWTGPAGTAFPRTLHLTYDGCDTQAMVQDGPSSGALGPGVDRSALLVRESTPLSQELLWRNQGAWALTSSGGISGTDLIEAGKAIVADPSSADPPLPGYTTTSTSYTPPVPASPTVIVQMTTPAGDTLAYRLAAPGKGPDADPFTTDVPVAIAGQDNRVVLRDAHTERWGPSGGRAGRDPSARYLGSWPGASIDIPRWTMIADSVMTPPQPGSAIDDDTVRTLVGSLRPATADQWRAFLATAATATPDWQLNRAASLVDDAIQGTTGTTAPSAPATSTTGFPATTTTAAGASDATDGYSELRDLGFRLELAADTVRSGSSVEATLAVHNRSDQPVTLTQCTLLYARLGLVSTKDPDASLPPVSGDHCVSSPLDLPPVGPTIVPANGDLRLPVTWRTPSGLQALRPDRDPKHDGTTFLGTLPPGTYDAVIEIPGRTSDGGATTAITVTEPLCPTTDDLVRSYLDLTSEQAASQAIADGLAYRAVSIDGVGQAITENLRCDRINVALVDDIVVGLVRY